MRILDLPYTFKVKGILKRRRLVEDHVFMDTTPVEIREVSKAEAPPAVTINQDGKRYVTRRLYDGKAVRPFRNWTKFNTKAGEMLELDRFEEQIASFLRSGIDTHWTSYPAPLDVFDTWNAPMKLPKPGTLEFRETHADRQAETLSAVNKMAQHLVAIDGKLWVADRAEVAWFVYETAQDVRVWLEDARIDRRAKHRFAGNRQHDAMGMAEHFARRSGKPLLAHDVTFHPQLDDWSIDDARTSLHDAACVVYEHASRQNFRELPADCFALFPTLRKAATGNPADMDLPEILMALGHFLEAAKKGASDGFECPAAAIVRATQDYVWRARTLDDSLIRGLEAEPELGHELGL